MMRKVFIVITALMLISATAAIAFASVGSAGDRIQDRVQDQIHDELVDQLRLRDGTCETCDQADVAVTESVMTEPIQERTQDRLRDGSCGDCTGPDGVGDMIREREQTRAQDQTALQEQAREQDQAQVQERDRDASCDDCPDCAYEQVRTETQNREQNRVTAPDTGAMVQSRNEETHRGTTSEGDGGGQAGGGNQGGQGGH